MREKVQFSINVPAIVAFESLPGEPVEGRYGDQMRYWLEDNGILFAEMDVARQVEALGVEPGEPVEIVKREKRAGSKRGIEWVVRKLEGEDGLNAVAISPTAHNASAVRSTASANVAAAMQSSAVRTAAGAPAVESKAPVAVMKQPVDKAKPPQTQSNAASLVGMRLAISAAVKLLAEAQRLAKVEGMLVEMTGADVRAMADCLYIQANKSSQNAAAFFGSEAQAAGGVQ